MREPKTRNRARRKLQLESLETRQMLAANPVITEFMASNDDSLVDGDGNSSDWIEIYNAGDASVDLAGYRLTDRADQLSKWVFPSVTVGPAEYLIVFASGQDNDDYRDAEGHLHTSFSLKASGEYLALVSPEGRVVSQFGSPVADFPPQLTDVSYGLAQQTTLIDASSEAAYWVPMDGRVDSSWTQNGFDAAANGFSIGSAALGYESRPDGPNSFAGDLHTTLPPRTHAVYARVEFSLEDASAVTELSLRMKYDNAFVAYLNGVKVAEDNAPGDPKWFSSALDHARRDSEALEPVRFDVSAHTGALVDGTNVLAIHGLNDLTDDSDMLLVPELVAVFSRGLSSVGYMRAVTPGSANVSESEVFAGFTSSPTIDVPRGFYDGPIDVSITADTPGAEIRFTTDGSRPTATHGTVYSGPIHISTTTTLRAATFRDRFLPSDVSTQTYIFLEDVIHQPANPPGLPRTWAGMGEAPIAGDYEMDPEVVDDPAYRDEIIDGLRSIATMSLVMDPEDLFGSDRGIYIHSGQRGSQWRRGTSVEIIEPDGGSFQADSGILIHGYSWRFHSNTPKHSFRLEFGDEYGPKKLEYPLFPDAPVDRFDSIVLRAQGGRAWAGLQNPHEAQYIRDAFARDTARDMGKVDGHAAFVHLYLNGLYWGLYHAVERPDAQMGEEYFGGSDQDYDALNRRTSTNEAIDGDLVRYNEMLALADRGLTTPEAYAEMQRYVDIDNLIDIFLIHQYTTNRDGPEVFQSNNQRAIGSRVGDPKFRFFVWDMEYSMWTANENININVDVPTSASHVYTKLRENPEFRMRYADRAHKHLFNGGALTPEAAANRWESRANEIYTAIIGESARWGDAKRARPYTRDVEWQRERNRLLTQYFPQRTNVLISQLRAANLYPSVDAPVFRQHGGPVAEGFQLAITNPGQRGTVLYTLDGSDPRQVGGAISPTAVIYNGSPIAIAGNITVKARVFSDREWSALNEANFVVVGPDSPFNLRVTEINYHPHEANLVPGLGEAEVASDEFEFVELTNVGSEAVDLSGVRLARAIEFHFPDGLALAPGRQVLVVKNESAFQSRYGAGLNVAGQFESGSLSDAGETLELRDRDGEVIESIRYESGRDWPQRAGGGGSTLQIVDPRGGHEGAESWRDSRAFGGSPGTAESASEARVVFTEVLPQGMSASSGMIELHNVTDQDVDISQWYVGHSSNDYFGFRFGASTMVPAGGFYVMSEAIRFG